MLEINLPPIVAFLPSIVTILFLAIVLRLYVKTEQKRLQKKEKQKVEDDIED